MKPNIHRFSHAPGLNCHRPARTVKELSSAAAAESYEPSTSSNGKVWKAAVFAGLALSGVALSGCNQTGVETQDVIVSTGRLQRGDDHFQTLQGFNDMSTSIGAGQVQGGGRFADPHGRQMQSGTRYLGAVEARDGAGLREVFQIHGNDGMLLHIEQLEVKTGVITDQTEETLTASFRGRQPIVSIVELESSGLLGFNRRDVETIHYLRNGSDVSVARVEEHVKDNEESRSGTTIDVDYQGKPFKVETDMPYFSWGSTSVDVNGDHAYSISHKFELGLRSDSNFKGYKVTRSDGSVAAEITVNTDTLRYQDAYDIEANGEKLGTVYLDDQSQPPAEGGGARELKKTFAVRLEGANDEERLANFERINLVLALMPDQINLNRQMLGDMEEALDAAHFALVNENKATADDQTREMAVAVATEEDPMTVARAIDTLILQPMQK